ncbi:hypothetical protein [Phenylobacterium sp.]|uniref:hypothetical protein n=1 Tax=Phenylobacterium sp. TaxID=1871053 RepID=UPI00391DAF79
MPETKTDQLTAARTIKDSNGRVLLFSCEQFVEDICLGDCCFTCGAAPGTKPFNNEHVIPRWVLKRYGLFDKQITLPNGEQHTYGTYRVPCCEACNTHLGRTVETPVSELLLGGHAQVTARLNPDTLSLLFTWLCLVFIKTHMKDRLLRVHRDPRHGQGKIADGYAWPDLHHIHAVARATYSGASLGDGVVGSMMFLPIDDPTAKDLFDWIDMTAEQTVALRIDDLGIVAVLNDACGAYHAISHLVARLEGPLTVTQLREVAARIGVANLDLKNRPVFGTAVAGGEPPRVLLWAKHEARPEFERFNPERYGSALAFALRDRLDHLEVDGERGADPVRAKLLTGRTSFLFDETGGFIRRIKWETRES